MALIQFSDYKTLKNFKNLRLNNGYPIKPIHTAKMIEAYTNIISQVLNTTCETMTEILSEQPLQTDSSLDLTNPEPIDFNSYIFQSYGLNPLKNILIDPDATDDIFTVHKPKDPYQTDNNEFYQTLINILSYYDILENYVIFVVFKDNNYGIFKLNFADITDYFESEDDECLDVELDIQICKGNPELFQMYDSMYNPSGYGLIIETDDDTWKIIR